MGREWHPTPASPQSSNSSPRTGSPHSGPSPKPPDGPATTPPTSWPGLVNLGLATQERIEVWRLHPAYAKPPGRHTYQGLLQITRTQVAQAAWVKAA